MQIWTPFYCTFHPIIIGGPRPPHFLPHRRTDTSAGEEKWRGRMKPLIVRPSHSSSSSSSPIHTFWSPRHFLLDRRRRDSLLFALPEFCPIPMHNFSPATTFLCKEGMRTREHCVFFCMDRGPQTRKTQFCPRISEPRKLVFLVNPRSYPDSHHPLSSPNSDFIFPWSLA